MLRTSKVLPCLVMLGWLSGVSSAHADPIRLSGWVQSTSSQSLQYSISGTGFSLEGSAGDFGSFKSCYGMPCFAGTPIPMDLVLAGSIGGGSGTIAGTPYAHLYIGGNLRFSGTGTFTGDGSTVVLTAPFTLVNSFLNAASVFDADVSLLNTAVTGQGIGTLTLHADPSYGVPGAYSFTSLRYDFDNTAVTPEPASLLLLGSGLAAAALARARQRRRAARG